MTSLPILPNIGTARMAQAIGAERQRAFLALARHPRPLAGRDRRGGQRPPAGAFALGRIVDDDDFLRPRPVHSPVHLAAAYATMVQRRHAPWQPTLLRQDAAQQGERIISEATSREMRGLMRAVVTEGTASFGDVEAMPWAQDRHPPPNRRHAAPDRRLLRRPQPGDLRLRLSDERPALCSRHVVAGAGGNLGPRAAAHGGWTAVPVGAEIIRRTAPLLGLRPEIEPLDAYALSSSSN